MKAFVKAASDHGLEHMVLLSGGGEDGALRAEEISKSSGLSWNIIPCSWFFHNFRESFMLEGILAGE